MDGGDDAGPLVGLEITGARGAYEVETDDEGTRRLGLELGDGEWLRLELPREAAIELGLALLGDDALPAR